MGIKEWFKNISGTYRAPPPLTLLPEPTAIPPMPKVKKPRKPKKAVVPDIPTTVSEKDIATAKGEPWVSITGMEVDMDHVENGSFTLDWNDKFVANLIRAGFKGKTDSDVVDQWFQTICRNIITEQFEQQQADPLNRNK